MKALIVDDSTINLKVAKSLIEHEGVVVETVTNGIDCIKKVQENEYDVIFMDIMMPKMDGIETFNNLKKIENFNIPVVTLTADAETGAKDKYLSMGFFDYLDKPLKIDKLKTVIKKVETNL